MSEAVSRSGVELQAEVESPREGAGGGCRRRWTGCGRGVRVSTAVGGSTGEDEVVRKGEEGVMTDRVRSVRVRISS